MPMPMETLDHAPLPESAVFKFVPVQSQLGQSLEAFRTLAKVLLQAGQDEPGRAKAQTK